MMVFFFLFFLPTLINKAVDNRINEIKLLIVFIVGLNFYRFFFFLNYFFLDTDTVSFQLRPKKYN
jgi:hypothetical protein